MDPLKTSIVAAWERGVEDYDQLVAHGRLTRTEADAWKAVLGRTLPPPPARILEVGAGTGVMSLLMAELGYELIATDLSRAMLQEARRKASQRALSITFEIADAEVLPFRDGDFDAVFGRHILWTLPYPDRALREWHRVLRSGGRLVLVDSLAIKGSIGAGLKRWVSGVLLSLRPRRRGGHRYQAGTIAALPLLGNSDPDRYSGLIGAAGFEIMAVETLDQLKALESRAMPVADRWHEQDRKFLFVARRD
jgi:ubiquinone/menaquinone biosynthesis C-methylase UbiE